MTGDAHDAPADNAARAAHWDGVYAAKPDDQLSWFEEEPGLSLALVERAIAEGARSVVDVGGGTSRLVDRLLDRSLERLAVLDVSEKALGRARERLGERAVDVRWIRADVTEAGAIGSYDVWNDRAVFHFLTAAGDRARYAATMARTVPPRGRAIVATFAPDGPQQCSGLDVARYDEHGLAKEFVAAFRLAASERVIHVTPAGKAQSFLYATFRRAD